MSDIKWQAPPPVQRTAERASKYDALREQLRQHPGSWAVLTETARTRSHAAGINRGAGKWREGAFEAAARSNGDGTYTIYVRHQADAKDEA